MKFEINFPPNSLLFEVQSTSTSTMLGRVPVPGVLLQELVVQVLLRRKDFTAKYQVYCISVGYLYWYK